MRSVIFPLAVVTSYVAAQTLEEARPSAPGRAGAVPSVRGIASHAQLAALLLGLVGGMNTSSDEVACTATAYVREGRGLLAGLGDGILLVKREYGALDGRVDVTSTSTAGVEAS